MDGDFADDFEVNDFYDDDVDQIVNDAGLLDDDHAYGLAGESGAAPHENGAFLGGQADPDAVPDVIADVRAYLPNCAPDACPVVVGTLAQADLDVGIDLRELSCATRNVEYMPNQLAAAATMRLHEPSAVVLVRSSGSLSITGAASVSEARQAAELAARIVRKALNVTIPSFRFRIRSIMARFNVCSPVRLEDLSRHRIDDLPIKGLGTVFGSFEPERFSACRLRLLGSGKDNSWCVSCHVFVTGKVTFLGARSLDELRFAFDAFVPIVSRYLGSTKKIAPPPTGV